MAERRYGREKFSGRMGAGSLVWGRLGQLRFTKLYSVQSCCAFSSSVGRSRRTAVERTSRASFWAFWAAKRAGKNPGYSSRMVLIRARYGRRYSFPGRGGSFSLRHYVGIWGFKPVSSGGMKGLRSCM